MFSKVDLPQPDGPTNTTNSPRCDNSRSIVAYRLDRGQKPAPNVLPTPWNRMSGGGHGPRFMLASASGRILVRPG